MAKLNGIRVAILATNGFEQSELEQPKKALESEGAKVDIIAPQKGKIKGWKHKDWGDEIAVDLDLTEARDTDYKILVLPGGVMNPDSLRLEPKAIEFIKKFVAGNKPIAAICHGPWTLIEAGAAKDKTLTSWPSLKTDLMNAGANWVDKEVVKDGNLITSRKPEDLKAFNAEIIKLLSA